MEQSPPRLRLEQENPINTGMNRSNLLSQSSNPKNLKKVLSCINSLLFGAIGA
jgi:hypothetical protein